MNLDLRIPMGLMFTLVGIILTAFGAATNSNHELYERSLGINATSASMFCTKPPTTPYRH